MYDDDDQLIDLSASQAKDLMDDAWDDFLAWEDPLEDPEFDEDEDMFEYDEDEEYDD